MHGRIEGNKRVSNATLVPSCLCTRLWHVCVCGIWISANARE